MKTRTKQITNPIYEQIELGDGEIIPGQLLRVEYIDVTEIEATEGKVIRRIADNALLDKVVTLGTEDSVMNYEDE